MTHYDEQDQGKLLTRRDFVKGAIAGAVGLWLPKELFGEGVTAKPASKNRSKVILVRDEAVITKGQVNQEVLERMLDRTILDLTGEKETIAAWKRFVKPADVVGIKINYMMTATHPEVVRAIVRNLHKVGVKDKNIIIWDRDQAGIGVEGILNRNKRFGYDKNSLSRIITDRATVLINVPGTKVHWLSGIGVALKNWVGALTNINVPDRDVAYAIHKDSCADLGYINALPQIKTKCRLVIVDALIPLFHGGPQVDPKYLWEYKGILMGTDPVAIDMICAKILQAKRNQYKGKEWPINPPIKHIFVADEKYGLGYSDPAKIKLVKRGWTVGVLI